MYLFLIVPEYLCKPLISPTDPGGQASICLHYPPGVLIYVNEHSQRRCGQSAYLPCSVSVSSHCDSRQICSGASVSPSRPTLSPKQSAGTERAELSMVNATLWKGDGEGRGGFSKWPDHRIELKGADERLYWDNWNDPPSSLHGKWARLRLRTGNVFIHCIKSFWPQIFGLGMKGGNFQWARLSANSRLLGSLQCSTFPERWN